jgi:hypothetical protein
LSWQDLSGLCAPLRAPLVGGYQDLPTIIWISGWGQALGNDALLTRDGYSASFILDLASLQEGSVAKPPLEQAKFVSSATSEGKDPETLSLD